ncbi:methyltransferase domain-containing protein [Streptomyces botrytidirepellens]|uniref:methyltransferase domain-containing protein n=1 Tax=Streptomyces botrytidirepellens TaxID=2486417 RepID=UPI001FEC8CD6|nr:methyltransferase domain-containing protein [Streptomyces botrytidirepellens]
MPERLRVLHWHGDTMGLPPDATLLAFCGRYPVQAFRIGGSAWGLQSRAARTTTRAFCTSQAATWEEHFAADGPRYAAAVTRMELRPGQRIMDMGCGTGLALPALRTEAGPKGAALGVDLTPAMLTAAAREGRSDLAHLLLADACRLPLPGGDRWTASSARA